MIEIPSPADVLLMLYSIVTSALALNIGSMMRAPAARAPVTSMAAVPSYETDAWKVYEHDSTLGANMGMSTSYASSAAAAAAAGSAPGSSVSPMEGSFIYGSGAPLSESLGLKTNYASPAKDTFERSVKPLESKFCYVQTGSAAPLRSDFLKGSAQEHMVVA